MSGILCSSLTSWSVDPAAVFDPRGVVCWAVERKDRERSMANPDLFIGLLSNSREPLGRLSTAFFFSFCLYSSFQTTSHGKNK